MEGYTELKNYRYERKFVSDISHKGKIDILLRMHPFIFNSLFVPRQVNNIYFDTPGMDCYFDNLFGVAQRWKARIRWYGEIGMEIKQPILELKIKHGHLGTKRSWRLNEIQFDGKRPEQDIIKEVLIQSGLPKDVENRLLGMNPVLVNNYQREYFSSFDKRYRITLDDKLEYRPFPLAFYEKNKVFEEKSKIVLELKYDFENDKEASKITNAIPFRLNKNSKYVIGMGFLRPGIAI